MTDLEEPRRGPIISDSPEGADAWERVPYDPADYGPVEDWATDLDHGRPEYNENAHQIWHDLREGGCPVRTPSVTAVCGHR